MTSASSSVAGLPLEQLALYHAVDPVLSSVFVFHGPVTTANSTLSSSRIQAHIFSPSGLQSYPRITVSPAAPLYAAVDHLPREKQGDEVYRGLAVCLLKSFYELSEHTQDKLVEIARSGKQQNLKSTQYFDEMHAADLANNMVKVENSMAVVRDLKDAFADRVVPWIDIDLILPPGSISVPEQTSSRVVSGISTEANPTSPCRERFSDRFGKYSSLIDTLGEPVFLPTSKLRRAPSQPTNLSKSKVFSASQKEALRLSMCEAVDTEERYVHKMYDLVNNVAQQFRQKARERSGSSTSPDESKLSQLFPPCLNEILDVNMGFLAAIRQILEQTEKEALADLSTDTTLGPSVFRRDSNGRRKDPMGIIAFAQCLLDWLPSFSQPYGQYMHAHTDFYSLLNSFLNDKNSSFSKRVYETGEQKMRSLLMEPIQRLPRYNLLIDAMTGSLPSMHPAVKPLLKARDTITEICSLDSYRGTDRSQNLKLLQSIVQGWPTSVCPSGRLITAADVYPLSPPFRSGSMGSRGDLGVMLLYTDYLVLLIKSPESKLTARGLRAELDKPHSGFDVDTSSSSTTEFKFSQAMPLDKVRSSQSKCARILYLVPAENFLKNERSRTKNMLLSLELTSIYEGKAGKLIEEITMARIEGRFPEEYRERGKWSLHNPKGTLGTLGTLVSVLEEDIDETDIPKSPSTVKITLDNADSSMEKQLGDSNMEIIVSVSSSGNSRYKMELDSVIGNSSSDVFPARDFIATLSKRINSLLRPLSQPRNPLLMETLLHTNFNILRIVAEHILSHTKTPKNFRPPSPSKLLSTFWGSGQSKEMQPPAKTLPQVPVVTNIPNFQPSNQTQKDDTAPKVSSVQLGGGITVSDQATEQLQQLEKTFTSYVLAIRSRRGNIVGRILRSRDRVDSAAVNELYNVLLEDCGKIQSAAEAPIDVLIVAFEKFIAKAWEDRLGPIVSQESLQLIQTKFDAMFPGDFEDFFRGFLSEMAPQSRRALTGLVKLLAELLVSSGNDGDRGALTAVFSEILTQDGDARQTIPLLDRLVEDFDRLFDENIAPGPPLEGTLIHDHSGLRSRAQSVNTGSMNSNTSSSFRKRFGFGLNRERSKTESEGKVSSIIRSLSKKSSVENASPSSSPSKESLPRSRSSDNDSRTQSLLRPRSKDRPNMQNLFAPEDDLCRPNSSHSNAPTLASIGEDHVVERPPAPRKKRRSSLSDLKPLPSVEVAPLFSKKNNEKPAPLPLSSSRIPEPGPKTPTQSSVSLNAYTRQSPNENCSPPRIPSPVRHVATNKKENVSPSPRTTLGERAVNRKPNGSVSPQASRKRTENQSTSLSKIMGPRERSTTTNNGDIRTSRSQIASPPKVQKLRMQNPQKLRERVQHEKKALASAESVLQVELSAISDEISALKTSPTKGRPSSSGPNSKSVTSPPSTTTASLASRVRTLESKVTAMMSNLGARATSLESDVESTILVSEKRARKLDELYRELSAENEALYERFNGELGKITNDVRLGTGEDAIKTHLKEALNEVARVKKENLRLKREVGGLRAQQSGGASGPTNDTIFVGSSS